MEEEDDPVPSLRRFLGNGAGTDRLVFLLSPPPPLYTYTYTSGLGNRNCCFRKLFIHG